MPGPCEGHHRTMTETCWDHIRVMSKLFLKRIAWDTTLCGTCCNTHEDSYNSSPREFPEARATTVEVYTSSRRFQHDTHMLTFSRYCLRSTKNHQSSFLQFFEKVACLFIAIQSWPFFECVCVQECFAMRSSRFTCICSEMLRIREGTPSMYMSYTYIFAFTGRSY